MAEHTSFGPWLKRLRAELDLTQEALADRVGCAVHTIRAFERGSRRPSRELAARLADILDVPHEHRATFARLARTNQETGSGVDDEPPAVEKTLLTAQQATPSALRPRLPVVPNPLIGRGAEQAEILRLLTDPVCRLLTLMGPGGIGKTRLAMEVASQQARQTNAQIVWVPLGSVTSPDFVAAAIADALGQTFRGSDAAHDQLIAHLLDKQVLLVLDNFEHLLDSIGLVESILQQVPGTRLLITSRERLRIQGEWVVELQGLPVPTDGARSGIERSEAALLFLERARQISGDFALSPANRGAVTRICRLLEGMPLGIELAATWVRTLSVEEIAQEIERNLDFLAISDRGTAPRHQSLRAVFEHSWHLATASERRILARLAVFRGGFDRAAAEQVADASLSQLSALIDKSLLRRTSTGRYDFHELVRQYASEKLTADPQEEQTTRDRHSRYFSAWLASREQPLKAALSDDSVVAEFRNEIDNLRTALAWMARHRKAAELRESIICLGHYYELRSWYREGATLCAQAANAFDGGSLSPTDSIAYGLVLGQQAWFTFRLGQSKQAQQLLNAALARLRQESDPVALFYPLFWLGYVVYATGNYAEARSLLQEGLASARAGGNEWCIAYALTLLGQVASSEGQLREAQSLLHEALGVWRLIGGGIAPCLNRLSAVTIRLGNLDEARMLLRESLERSSSMRDRMDMGTAFSLLGEVARLQGEHAEAEYLFRETLALFREIGNHWGEARVLINLGELAATQNDAVQARRHFHDALKMATEAQLLPVQLDVLFSLARLKAREGVNTQAMQWLAQVRAHPATEYTTREQAEQLWSDLSGTMAPEFLMHIKEQSDGNPLETDIRNALGVA